MPEREQIRLVHLGNDGFHGYHRVKHQLRLVHDVAGDLSRLRRHNHRKLRHLYRLNIRFCRTELFRSRPFLYDVGSKRSWHQLDQLELTCRHIGFI
jgi:hypothetical protein